MFQLERIKHQYDDIHVHPPTHTCVYIYTYTYMVVRRCIFLEFCNDIILSLLFLTYFIG